MRYLLLIYCDENAYEHLTGEEGAAVFAGYNTLTTELTSSGKLVGSDALQPTSTATLVRVRNGETLTLDGPYAETKEQLGGFYEIDADDLDEAIKWAAMIPVYGNMSVEVRPVMTFD
jgi:hypothetical protein